MNSKLIIALLMAAVCVELNQGALNPIVRAGGYRSPGTEPKKPVPGNAATTAPPAVTAAPTAVTAAPTKVTAAPTKVTAAPTKVTAAPTKVTAAPTKVTAAPTKVTAAPTAVTAAPTAVTAAPTAVTAAPTAVTAAPTAVTAAPTAVTAAPTAVTAAPTAVSAAPTAVTAAPTAAPGAGTNNPSLTPLDRNSLYLINSFRISHNAPEVTYNTTLASTATQCAEMHAQENSLTTPACNCGSNGAETCGISANESPSHRAREAISDPNQLSWFSQYVNPTGPALSWPNPVYDVTYADYTQMIWVDTQMVGCGTSTTQTSTLVTNPPIQAPQYVYCCCWVKAGNSPSTFSQNVLEDTV